MTNPPSDPNPADNPGDPSDDFPKPGDGTTTIQYMAGGRFSANEITRMGPGPVIGDLVSRVSRLYSALQARGSNLARSVENAPFYLRELRFGHSVDLIYEIPSERAAPTLYGVTGDDELQRLSRLAGSEGANIAEVAAEYGGAVATAYRQLAALLGDKEISAEFFIIQDERRSEQVSLPADRAITHAEALSSQDVLRVETSRLTGLLDELAGQRSSFKLIRSSRLPRAQDTDWREALGGRRYIEGEFTDEAAVGIRRLNAWRSLVTVEVQLTYMTSPTTTRREEIDALLLRVLSVQPELSDRTTADEEPAPEGYEQDTDP